MKLHIITVGEPKLAYAREGWQEYLKRLKRYHVLRTTHLANKRADDVDAFLNAAGHSYKVALAIDGQQLSSAALAEFLQVRELDGKELSFIIGGPEGLPPQVIEQTDFQLSLSRLTFPHDLAMLILLETLYRASTIVTGHPYHRG